MNSLDSYLAANLDNTLKVTKMKSRDGGKKSTLVPVGSSYFGQVTLRNYNDNSLYLAVNGGYTLRTSPVTGFKKEAPDVWLVRTLNSIYKVERDG